MDGRLTAEPEGPTAVSAQPEAAASPAVLAALIARLRAIVGDRWCYEHEHQLRTYESDGLLQYTSTPRAAVLPGSAEELSLIHI